jgi:hypothetical protein
MLGRIEEIATTLSSYEDIDYSPVYEWDINLEGFTIFNVKDQPAADVKKGSAIKRKGFTFYEGIKLRMYGRISANFPPYYLEDMDEFELSQSEIFDLDGIQYCTHAIVMDLSDNSISDISLLWGLTLLQELNLSYNRIEEIEALANLRNLRTLNLSNNGIKDISYLLNLPNLEFVDLAGTRVPASQIRELEDSGICVKK